jgi:nucleoside-diphosphate-sugar epimerase
MKVLLTGATGFIGSHVARELLRRGHEIHATVRPTSDRRRIADIESKLTIWPSDTMASLPLQADVTIHLAWYAVPGKYLTASENRQCFEESWLLLSNLEKRAVFIGTCFEHDLQLGVLREDSPTKPATLYAERKDALRQLVEKRPDSAWVRFFYQYGPWEDERRLMPAVMLGQLRGQPTKVSTGEQRYDYLHVEDVASAVCAVAESRLTGCVNIGSGSAPSVREIVTEITALGGRPELIQWGAYPAKPGEPKLIQCDNARLRSTGWSPRWSLSAGLKHTFEWWRQRT